MIKGRPPTGSEEEAHSRGYCRPHQEGSRVRGVSGVVLSFLLLLGFSHQTRGETYNTTRLETVRHMTEKQFTACVRPLNPETVLAARMYVKSTAVDIYYDAGNVTIEGMQANVWHEISLNYGTERYVHTLVAAVDGETIPFNKPDRKMFTSAYEFFNIDFLVKGTVQITSCPPPEDPTTTAEPTTTTATTTEVPVYEVTRGQTTSPILKFTETRTLSHLENQSTSPKPYDINTTPDTGVITAGDGESWIWLLGTVGTVPALPLIIGVAVLVIVIAIILLLCCFKKRTKRDTKEKKANDRKGSYPLAESTVPLTSYGFDERNAKGVYSAVPEDEVNGRQYQDGNMSSFQVAAYQHHVG